MNTVLNKKILLVVVFLTLCCFSFAQNIKIIGAIPRTDTGKMYQLQIGAFRLAANVNNAADILTRNGFVPQFEKKGDLVRVFVVFKAAEVRSAVDKLGRAGFKEVIIREYSGRITEAKPVEVPPVVTTEPKEPEIVVTVEEEIPFEDVKEDIEIEDVKIDDVFDFELEEEVDFDINIEFEFEIEIEFDLTVENDPWDETPVFEAEEPENDLMHILEE